MDITKKCVISQAYGFELNENSKFAIIEVQAKNGDVIKVNKVDGIRYNEIYAANELPRHEEHPIIDNENKVIVVGGEEKQSKRTITLIGK